MRPGQQPRCCCAGMLNIYRERFAGIPVPIQIKQIVEAASRYSGRC